MITINSFDTGLTQDERAKLYPTCGHLNPDGLQELRRTDNYDAVRDVASRYPVRLSICDVFLDRRQMILIEISGVQNII